MARAFFILLVLGLIGLIVYIDVNAYKLGFTPPSQRNNAKAIAIASRPRGHFAGSASINYAQNSGSYFASPSMNYTYAHSAHSGQAVPAFSPAFGTGGGTEYKPEFGQPRSGY